MRRWKQGVNRDTPIDAETVFDVFFRVQMAINCKMHPVGSEDDGLMRSKLGSPQSGTAMSELLQGIRNLRFA